VASRVEISDEWREPVTAAIQALFQDRLGPAIAGDARRYCPVDTEALKDSIEHHLEEGDLIVSASGGAGGRTYAAYVELGTAPHVIRSHGPYPLRNPRTGQVFGPVVHHPGTKAQPFLRPALFQQRSE